MSTGTLRRVAALAVTAATLIVSVAFAAGGGSAARAAATQPYELVGATYSLSFSPNQPATSTSFTFTAASKLQPSSIAVTLPAGTRLNSASVPPCAAPPTCDSATQVGTGTAYVHYSTNAFSLGLAIFNRAGGLAIVIQNPNGKPVLIQPTWSGSTLTVPYPNAYYKGVAIQVVKVSLTFYKLGSGRTAYLRTPPHCGKGGWSSTGTFSFTDGTQGSLNSAAKCHTKKKKKKKKKKKT